MEYCAAQLVQGIHKQMRLWKEYTKLLVILHVASNIQQMDLDFKKLWEGVLSSTIFAVLFTVHTTTQHTPSQLVFGRNTILNINQGANRQYIKQREQALINKGNQKENRRR